MDHVVFTHQDIHSLSPRKPLDGPPTIFKQSLAIPPVMMPMMLVLLMMMMMVVVDSRCECTLFVCLFVCLFDIKFIASLFAFCLLFYYCYRIVITMCFAILLYPTRLATHVALWHSTEAGARISRGLPCEGPFRGTNRVEEIFPLRWPCPHPVEWGK